MEKVMAHLGYFDLCTVEPVGKSGGLALMWKETVQVKILYTDRRMIDTQITWQDKVYFLTCVYGDPFRDKRGRVWERLTRIGLARKGQWLLIGDFNELVDPSEKKGGVINDEEDCMEFRQMLRSCGLWEIRHEGYQFSWYRVRNDEIVQCRLDRTVANQIWQGEFPQAKAISH